MFVIPYSKIPMGEGGHASALKYLATPACRTCARQLVVEFELEIGYSDPETVACPVCGSYCINDSGEIAIIGSTSTPRVKGWLQLNDKRHEIAWVNLDSPSEMLVGVMLAHLGAHEFSKSYTQVGVYLNPSHLKRGSAWPGRQNLSQLTCSKLTDLAEQRPSNVGSRELLGGGLKVSRSEDLRNSPDLQRLSALARESLAVLRTHTRPCLGSASKLPLNNIQPLTLSSRVPPGMRVSWDSNGLSRWVIDTQPHPTKRTPQRRRKERRKVKTVKRRATRTR